MKKVSVIGTGFVGATSAYAIALMGICSDLMLVDINEERARAESADISHGAAITTGVRVHSGEYGEIKDSSAIIIAAGVNRKPGESRLDLLARNAAIFRGILPHIVKYAPEAIVVVATNPVDIMTDVTRVLHPNPGRVLGTGTVLDTGRFRDLLGRASGINAQHIHANVIGEHGDSSVLCWNQARVANAPIPEVFASLNKAWSREIADGIETKVRSAAATIICGKQATYYGIGAAAAKIVKCILQDARAVMTVSGPSKYGVSLSLPRVIGKTGIFHTFMPELSGEEKEKLDHSAKALGETKAAIINGGELIG